MPFSSGVVIASLVDVIFLHGSNLSTIELISQLSQSPAKRWIVAGLYCYYIVIIALVLSVCLSVIECCVNSPGEGV